MRETINIRTYVDYYAIDYTTILCQQLFSPVRMAIFMAAARAATTIYDRRSPLFTGGSALMMGLSPASRHDIPGCKFSKEPQDQPDSGIPKRSEIPQSAAVLSFIDIC
jgi:hypothetical protein